MRKWVWAALYGAMCSSLVGSMGCGKSPTPLPDGGSEVDAGPEDAGPPLATTYRIISGVSMGAIGASTMGLHHPELFDGVAALGGPLDARYLLRVIEKFHLGGFCTLAELETQLARDPAGLNDPSVMTCMHQVQGTVATEHTQSFSHWRFTSSGGHFTRSSYLDLFADLSLSFGNPVSYNPDSPFAPQGVPVSWALHPPADSCTHPFVVKGKLSDPSATPIYNKEYNPEGKYDAISFCDGEESPIYYCVATKKVVDFCAHGAATPVPKGQEAQYATTFCQAQNSAVDQATDDDTVSDEVLAIYNAEQGRYDPCREHFEPIRVGLAFDMNHNGRRDFAEPVAVNNHERYQDTGKDGCTDELEDGHGGCVTDPTRSPHQSGVADPNGDNYDPKTNPLGTEGNWAHDDGEPYEDFGLDGVAGTHDYGEGDGKFNLSPNLDRFMAYDPVNNFNKLTAEQKRLIDIYLDGGRIDVFNFGVAADLFGKAISFASPLQQSAFTGFSQLPNRDPATATLSLDENRGRHAGDLGEGGAQREPGLRHRAPHGEAVARGRRRPRGHGPPGRGPLPVHGELGGQPLAAPAAHGPPGGRGGLQRTPAGPDVLLDRAGGDAELQHLPAAGLPQHGRQPALSGAVPAPRLRDECGGLRGLVGRRLRAAHEPLRVGLPAHQRDQVHRGVRERTRLLDQRHDGREGLHFDPRGRAGLAERGDERQLLCELSRSG